MPALRPKMAFGDPAEVSPTNRPFAFALPAVLATRIRARAGGGAMKKIAARPGAVGANPLAGAGKGGKGGGNPQRPDRVRAIG
jgi:hypothetical protein